MTMGSTHDQEDPAPTYPGEDTRPTSKKELLGFYGYSFAAEVFVVCALGAFIPITLEDLARASPTAVLANDHTRPCRVQSIEATKPKHTAEQCVFRLLGTEINTASFAMYSFSLSVLVQAVVVVTMSGAADHGHYRKTLLWAFAVAGAVATMLFLPVTPSVFWLGSLFAIIGNVCFGASFVLLNSFLPLLVRNHPIMRAPSDQNDPEVVQEVDTQINDGVTTNTVDESTSLLQRPSLATINTALYLSTTISANGVGIGYFAAVIMQILSIFILTMTGADLYSLRVVLFCIGLWWLLFTIPAVLLLRTRPGPPLPLDPKTGKARSWSTYLAHSWISLGKTVTQARRLKDVLFFLAAWFMISDAIATVSGTAILYAKTTLAMKPSALALINVIVTLTGIVGALTWSKISRMAQLTPSQTILICMCLFELIPLYALLGYLPAVQRLGYLGLQQQWEVYPMGAVYGLVLGGLSSYCRSLFGELIPPGNEATFYALYAITDKGSSIFGPTIVGAITDLTGEIRPSFWFLAILIALPIPLMSMVDVERGKREGAALAEEANNKFTDEALDENDGAR